MPQEPDNPAQEAWERFRSLAGRLLRVPKTEDKDAEPAERGETDGDNA